MNDKLGQISNYVTELMYRMDNCDCFDQEDVRDILKEIQSMTM